MITRISPTTICQHANIDSIPSVVHFIAMTHLFCNCRSVPLNLPSLLLYSLPFSPVEPTYLSWVVFVLSWFLGVTVVKNLPANAGDTGDVCSIPESGRSLE